MEERQAVPVISGEHAKVQTPKSQVDWRGIWKPLVIIIGGFLVFFWLPVTNSRFTGAVIESLALAKWYAQEHVILCLVPAFFIAGAIACFVSQAAVMKYLGAGAKKVLAYGVASVSGTILAVCSCTVLPLFASIWKRGAGLGPATAFLYSGPAVNVLAIVLTGKGPVPCLYARAGCAATPVAEWYLFCDNGGYPCFRNLGQAGATRRYMA
jgi:uncharacterized membrane protein YraQ (UPF0718 family)